MQKVFLYFINTGLTACYLIAAVILVRLLLSRAPKGFRLFLWAAVGVRLMLPVSIESSLSLLPKEQLVPTEMVFSNSGFEPTFTEVFDYIGNNPVHYDLGLSSEGSLVFTEFTAPDTQYLNPLLIILTVAAILWLVGLAAMVLYAIISGLLLHRTVRASVSMADGIMICDNISTPFIFGFFSPKIYVPSDTDPSRLPFITMHEKAHLTHRDHLWKILGFAVLSVYWFHPLVWVCYILFCRDIEFACDERVIKNMELEGKKAYSMALLSCSTGKNHLPVYPLAFAESSIKKRVKNVIKHKKPTIFIIILSIVLLAAVAVFFFAGPQKNTLDKETEEYLHHAIIDYHAGDYYTAENSFACEDHIILKTEKKGDVTTVYALVMYQNFSCENGVLKVDSGAHIPSVITLDMGGSGYSYNYWQSKDGTRYVPSIRDKFPWYLEEKAIHIERYSREQSARCIAQAEDHFGVSYRDPYENMTTPTTTAVESDSENMAIFEGSSYMDFEKAMEYINDYRTRNGLPKLLTDNEKLKAATITRTSECMVSFSHVRPNGSDYASIISESEIPYTSVHEILSRGQTTAEVAVNQWIVSPKHRDIILNPDVKYGCVFCAEGDYNGTPFVYWVFMAYAP